MNKYKLTKQDYKRIYNQALSNYKEKGLQSRDDSDTFLVRCVVEAFISFSKNNNLTIENGNINEGNEQPKKG